MKKLIFLLRPFSKYLLIIWLITIAVMSSIPHLPEPKIHTGGIVIRLDYFIHFCEYGLLTFLTLLSFAGTDLTIRWKKYVLLALALMLFALADEFHQKLIPGRSFNPRDIMSNMTGIVAGIIFCLLIFNKSAPENK